MDPKNHNRLSRAKVSWGHDPISPEIGIMSPDIPKLFP